MSEVTLRCPEQGCIGWAMYVDQDDEPFWGCGECGNVWSDRVELDNAISESIKTYPYRRKVYQQRKGLWDPVPFEKEPEDYEDLVEAEFDDEDDDTSDY